MANIILPAVPVLNEIDDSAKLLIEQAGEINRYPISDLDIGIDIDESLSATSVNPVQNKVIKEVIDDLTNQIADAGSIDIDLTGANESEANPINADTLGGYLAEEYIKKTVSEEDEGKFLRVVNGVATWTSIPNVREGSF